MSEYGEEGDQACGFAYDHEVEWNDFVDGARTGMCRLCGGELWEDEPTP